MKDKFLRSLSGCRFIRLSAVNEFKVCETGTKPPCQVVVFLGSEAVVLIKGTWEQCIEYIEKTIQTE